jgi:hypothetical protein
MRGTRLVDEDFHSRVRSFSMYRRIASAKVLPAVEQKYDRVQSQGIFSSDSPLSAEPPYFGRSDARKTSQTDLWAATLFAGPTRRIQ